MAELLLAFKRYADCYYAVEGKTTAAEDCLNSAMCPVRELFAMLPAKDFSPLNLKAVQQRYVDAVWTRGLCNASTNRIRRIFMWVVANGMVPVTTWQALTALSPLKSRHPIAPDNKRREAIPDEHLAAVRPLLKPHHCDWFDLGVATGARPGELIGLSMADIGGHRSQTTTPG